MRALIRPSSEAGGGQRWAFSLCPPAPACHTAASSTIKVLKSLQARREAIKLQPNQLDGAFRNKELIMLGHDSSPPKSVCPRHGPPRNAHPPQPVWVGQRPGQARLWMGVGAIVTFGSISGGDASHDYTEVGIASCTGATGHGAPGSLHTGGASKVGYSPISTSVLYLLVLDQVRHNQRK